MKKTYSILMISLLSFGSFRSHPCLAQDKFYTSSGFEMLFSWANIHQEGIHKPSIIRWAPVINIQTFANYDLSNKFGFFTGIGIRNTGFIYNVDEFTKRKARTYNAGIPFGIKAGNFDKIFFYTGYEIEFPINYRERSFTGDQKVVFNEWFSSRVPTVYHSLLVGLQLPRGLNLKFKYYFTNFYNKRFTEIEQGTGDPAFPYEDLDINIFYISLGMNLFKDKEIYFLDL